jgi:hypothetical protein
MTELIPHGFFVMATSPRDPSKKLRHALVIRSESREGEDDPSLLLIFGQSLPSIDGPVFVIEPRSQPPYPIRHKTWFFLSSAVWLLQSQTVPSTIRLGKNDWKCLAELLRSHQSVIREAAQLDDIS